MDQMDVDQSSSTSKRPADSPPLETPSEKTPRSFLRDDELGAINQTMHRFCQKWNWPEQISSASRAKVLDLLVLLCVILGRSSMTDIISADAVPGIAQELGLEALRNVMKKCAEDGNWTSTIELLRGPPAEAREFHLYRDSIPSTDLLDTDGLYATLDSWKREFVGSSADLVHDILTEYMAGRSSPYARYVEHIQSSGGGKSRIHNELAKRMFYIPISFALKGANSYPPPDPQVRSWFAVGPREATMDKWKCRKKCHTFLHAVMIKAKEELNVVVGEVKEELEILDKGDKSWNTMEERLRLLASTFRKKMSEGGTFFTHGPFRTKFYDDVIEIAEQLAHLWVRNHQVIAIAAEEVLEILAPGWQRSAKPLLIISWDEAQPLPNRGSNDIVSDGPWSRFSEIRLALNKIARLSIFSVFLSRTPLEGLRLIPGPTDRLSAFDVRPFSPITEVGFDEFAIKVKPNGETTLTQVASTHNMAHLGRALFATRYDCTDDKRAIADFAQTKLLCRRYPGQRPLEPAAVLACLAVRLGLEFRGTWWGDREAEREQVDRHMRLCLAATADPNKMVTISPSEPLLAEAAFETMEYLDRDTLPRELLTHIYQSYLNPGNRGELVAALLVLLARDNAVREQNRKDTLPLNVSDRLEDDGAPRIITVSGFLDALLAASHHEFIKGLKPSRYHRQENAVKSLDEAFAQGYIWFNHFIKVNDFLVVNRQYLWCLITRGAAVICANNQHGIDIVIPILFGSLSKPEAVSAILIQVKNDSTFTDNPRTALFDLMDPFKAPLFSKNETPLPVLRLVFALASEKAGVTTPKRRPRQLGSTDKYTAYDIWIAGATPESFGVITQGSAESYKYLIERSCRTFGGYDLFDKTSSVQKDRASARRRMHPGAATKIEHQENYILTEELPFVELDDSGDVLEEDRP